MSTVNTVLNAAHTLSTNNRKKKKPDKKPGVAAATAIADNKLKAQATSPSSKNGKTLPLKDKPNNPNSPKVVAQAAKVLADIDSDADLAESNKLIIFDGKAPLPATAMTVICNNKHHLKGSRLIEIVHEIVHALHKKEISGGFGIPYIIPEIKGKATVRIKYPSDWITSLGGWKVMAYNEIRGKAFGYRTFDGAEISENGITFLIKDMRIHLPVKFSIAGFDVTDRGTEIKTDLSYRQIFNVIMHIMKKYRVTDSHIAVLQLFCLSGKLRQHQNIEWFDILSKEERAEISVFLDYVNALMFGIEASGLNAGLAIGLMILDLIANQECSYYQAFCNNELGGLYPYACCGDNEGTYNKREEILDHANNNAASMSMKQFRQANSPSPVATKEAVLIKYWLRFRQVTQNITDSAAQEKTIIRAIEELIRFYFLNEKEK